MALPNDFTAADGARGAGAGAAGFGSSAKARLAMAIDLDRCIGCRTCAVVCKNFNSQPQGIWWNRVFTSGTPDYDVAVPVAGQLRMEFVPISCQHCTNAPCETMCPTQATYIDPTTGTVLVDYERCIGCRMCASACPYGVRQFNWGAAAKMAATGGGVLEYGYPNPWYQGDHLVYAPVRPEGVMEKCTFCVQLTSQGDDPACCTACPGNARIFGDLNNPNSAISLFLAQHKADGQEPFILGEEYNTQPNVFYLASHPVTQANAIVGSDSGKEA